MWIDGIKVDNRNGEMAFILYISIPGPSLPGTNGTPQLFATSLAAVLSPII